MSLTFTGGSSVDEVGILADTLVLRVTPERTGSSEATGSPAHGYRIVR